MCLLRINLPNLWPNMNNFDAVDFNECHSEEVISFFWCSVLDWCICRWSLMYFEPSLCVFGETVFKEGDMRSAWEGYLCDADSLIVTSFIPQCRYFWYVQEIQLIISLLSDRDVNLWSCVMTKLLYINIASTWVQDPDIIRGYNICHCFCLFFVLVW